MEQVTQQNATSSEESVVSSQEFKIQAEVLQDVVRELTCFVHGVAANLEQTVYEDAHYRLSQPVSKFPKSAGNLTQTGRSQKSRTLHRLSTQLVNPQDALPLHDDDDFNGLLRSCRRETVCATTLHDLIYP